MYKSKFLHVSLIVLGLIGYCIEPSHCETNDEMPNVHVNFSSAQPNHEQRGNVEIFVTGGWYGKGYVMSKHPESTITLEKRPSLWNGQGAVQIELSLNDQGNRTIASAPNVSLLDQASASQWLKDHHVVAVISSFHGGDKVEWVGGSSK